MKTYNYSHFDITLGHRVIWKSLTFEQLRDRLMYTIGANISDPIVISR
jgi:hypothetical protein